MLVFTRKFSRSQYPRQARPPANGHGRCPQPMCLHPAHNGIPIPTQYKGTSVLQGMVIHHVRCAVNPAHHRQFVQVGNQWQEIKPQ